MAYARKKYGKGRKTRKLNAISSGAVKRTIDKALRAKGKGSVTRIWGMAKSAGYRGQIGLATSLGRIAQSKAGYASRKRR